MCLVAEITYLIYGGPIFYSIIHIKEGITSNCQRLLSQSFKMNGNKLLAPC